MSNDFLQVRNLEVIYTSGKDIVQAVNGVSLDLERGKTLALVGETGAGKTTVAKSILRILPDPPAILKGGSITLDGVDILKLPEEQMLKVRGDKIAMIFQDPMTALNPTMKIGDQIVECLMLHNDYTVAQASKRAQEMLELVGIPARRAQEYPFEFSGGMKQRVIIAMALACSPELLLADEPTTALDVTIQAQVLDLIKELQQQYNTSMILITHDLGVVARTSDYVAVMYAGQIVEYGSLEQIFDHPYHPYTVGLFDSLPKIDVKTDRLKPIPGNVSDPTRLPEGCYFHPRCQYATEECKSVRPEMTDLGDGHLIRCHNKAGR